MCVCLLSVVFLFFSIFFIFKFRIPFDVFFVCVVVSFMRLSTIYFGFSIYFFMFAL
ncbi:hypothetical protein DFH27DRAFT_568900 [Peziza echinospora]|nr:hypothetical protein DFH27DRAFT_568900 [Peziza echinospora]